MKKTFVNQTNLLPQNIDITIYLMWKRRLSIRLTQHTVNPPMLVFSQNAPSWMLDWVLNKLLFVTMFFPTNSVWSMVPLPKNDLKRMRYFEKPVAKNHAMLWKTCFRNPCNALKNLLLKPMRWGFINGNLWNALKSL